MLGKIKPMFIDGVAAPAVAGWFHMSVEMLDLNGSFAEGKHLIIQGRQ